MSGYLYEANISILNAGRRSLRALQAAHVCTVFGVTSRGVFLRSEMDDIVFLSYESHRGPLTLNLAGDLQRLNSLEIGARLACSPDRLHLPDGGSIHLLAKVWEAPMPNPAGLLPPLERQQRLRQLAQRVLHEKHEGLADLLAVHLGLADGQSEDARFAARLRQSIARRDPFLDVSPMLGRGRGLTPSGDDFVLGLLLALSRWGGAIGWSPDAIKLLNTRIAEEAAARTTLLSTRLLQAAGEGQADERLTASCDSIFGGTGELEDAAKGLLGWGASSGMDALAGMACVV